MTYICVGALAFILIYIVYFLCKQRRGSGTIYYPYYLIGELHSMCRKYKDSTMAHVWISDQCGAFVGIVGEVGKDHHLEAAYSLDAYMNFHEDDYGKTWLAFPTRKAAEEWSWSLS